MSSKKFFFMNYSWTSDPPSPLGTCENFLHFFRQPDLRTLVRVVDTLFFLQKFHTVLPYVKESFGYIGRPLNIAILMIQALEHKDKTRQFDTGNHKGFLGKACTDKVELYISRVIFLFLQTDICWSNQVSKENDKMNYCTRRSFWYLLRTFLGAHFI